MFQYPLADRLGFWGLLRNRMAVRQAGFSILWRIDLVFGEDRGGAGVHQPAFQYPLADRLGFWGGAALAAILAALLLFQYPLADRLGFWGHRRPQGRRPDRRFSILWRIDLVFGGG